MAIARSKGDKALDWGIIILMVIITVVTLYPLWFVLIASFSDPTAISSGKVVFWPVGFNFAAYGKLLKTARIWIGYRNSLLYTVFGTLINLFVTVSAGFALSRSTLPGRRWLIVFFIITMYVSGGTIPNYMLMKSLGLLNTIWVILLPGAMNVYNMIIARSYFESSIPESIYESANIDGAGWLRCYMQFAIPLAKPMIAVLTLFFALGHWNSYFNPMIYITDDKIQVLQVIIKQITASVSTTLNESISNAEMIRQVQEKQLLKYAVVVVSIVPMVMLYPFVQRFLIQGVMIGAVKG